MPPSRGYYIGLSTCSATSCAATALPSCLPPSGKRATSTWRLRSSSADASEDAFFVSPPELVCLCSSSLKDRGRGLGRVRVRPGCLEKLTRAAWRRRGGPRSRAARAAHTGRVVPRSSGRQSAPGWLQTLRPP